MGYILTAILVLIRIFSVSACNVFQKKLAQLNETPVRINYINYVFLALFSLCLFLFIDKANLSSEFIFYSVLGGIFGGLGNYFMVEALKYGELSVLAPINSYKVIVALLFGIILLGEIPKLTGILGILLIILGSYFIFNSFNIFEILKRREVRFRFLALVFTGIEAIFIKKVILLSSIELMFCANCTLGLVFSFLILKIKKEKAKIVIKKEYFPMYLLTAISFGVMAFITAVVFKRLQVGYALSLFQLSILLNLFFGWKIFREKDIIRKLIGSLIIISGAILIILKG